MWLKPRTSLPIYSVFFSCNSQEATNYFGFPMFYLFL